jgi:hypothetical protein
MITLLTLLRHPLERERETGFTESPPLRNPGPGPQIYKGPGSRLLLSPLQPVVRSFSLFGSCAREQEKQE